MEVAKVRAKRNSFQAAMKTEDGGGEEPRRGQGRMMRRAPPSRVLPSMREASSSSAGMERKKPRENADCQRQAPKGVVGMISPS